MILWTMDPAERDANLVHEAVKKKDESYVSVLVEVSCASTPDHLMAVRKIYRKLFSSSVEEDVASSPALQEPLKTVREIMRGNVESSVQALVSFAACRIDMFRMFRLQKGLCSCTTPTLQMLLRLVSSYRYAGEHVDMDVAKLEAAQLSEAIIEKRLHGDEVARIISTRSKPQLRATFQQYKDDQGTDVVEVRCHVEMLKCSCILVHMPSAVRPFRISGAAIAAAAAASSLPGC
jgi:hypothetical protein